MPKILPTEGLVSWPQNEGVLGIVGVAPWATLEFCHCFYSLFSAQKDWEYPRVLLDVNTKLPSRGRHLELGEEDPSPYISATIAELAAAGATVAVVACNTAHILFDRWGSEPPIPVIHIVDAAIKQACFEGAKEVTAFTSESLSKADLYGKSAEAQGLIFKRLPAGSQTIVNQLIQEIKVKGRLSHDNQQDLSRLLINCLDMKVDTVILGCTELSTLLNPLKKAGFMVVDSNISLAKAACAMVRK